MRAKMKVTNVQQHFSGPERTPNQLSQETVSFSAVGKSTSYDSLGSDEDNTFAKYTPSADAWFAVMNPDLFGKFAPGDTFYVDFTRAEK
jgi:hypothetical protein